jgi:threonine dehydrogenase-like Zn-dependent dehydrogenase
MRGAVLHAPGDVRLDTRPDPQIEQPTDAIIKLTATCVCGSDLWPYRGIETVDGPAPMGHEYVGIVEEVGSDVTEIKPGQFVIGSFFASDDTCEICRAGYQSRCVHAELMGRIGTQAEYARVPLADGTLVATPDVPDEMFVPSLLAASDVLGTGWFAADAPKSVRVRPSQSSETARSAYSAFSPLKNSAPSGSSPSPVTRTGRSWPGSSAPPTSSPNAATTASPESRT